MIHKTLLLIALLPLTAVAQSTDADIDAFIAKQSANVNIVKRALNKSGTLISCVDTSKQPASSHRLWPGKPQEPSEQLKALLPGRLVPAKPSETCPLGSVEMVLPTKEQIRAAGGLDEFRKKTAPKKRDSANDPVPIYPGASKNAWGYSYHASVEEWQTAVTAAQTTMNIWGTPVTGRNFSLSQMWVLGYWGASLSQSQSIEAGVQVFPVHYGNSQPNFFVYWKQDWSDPNSPSCYNMDCVDSGWSFVKSSDVLPIGLPVPSTSTLGGQQVEGTIAWYRDPANGNWCLMFRNADGTYTLSGYYPAYYFGSGQLTQSATRVMFGGEILQEGDENTLPTVLMGSDAGNHPWYTTPLYGNVAYQRDLQVMGLDGVIRDFAPAYNTMAPDAALTGYPRGCAYGLSTATRAAPFVAGWGFSLFFGGDGIGGSQGC